MTIAEAMRCIRRKLLGSETRKPKTDELAAEVHSETQLLRDELQEIRKKAKRDHGGDLLAALIHTMNRNTFLRDIEDNNGRIPD